MTLPFMTHFPKGLARIGGKETFFVEKIQQSMLTFQACGEEMPKPKLHTFREDPKDLWHAGRDIHAVVHNRTPQRFQFLPVIQVVSTQTVEIEWPDHDNQIVSVTVDGRAMEPFEIITLAHNDGFDSVADFFAYFNRDWKGKIIHWTDLRY